MEKFLVFIVNYGAFPQNTKTFLDFYQQNHIFLYKCVFFYEENKKYNFCFNINKTYKQEIISQYKKKKHSNMI